MADVTQTFKDRLDDLIVSGELKLFIADDNDAWVDFSDRLEVSGKNVLLRLGEIIHRTESKAVAGGFQTSVNTILLDNSDRFWDGVAPTGLLTTAGATATFSPSIQYESTAWYRRQVKLAFRLNLKDGTSEEGELGIFLIDGLTTSSDAGTADLRVIGLAKRLIEESAEKIKDGQGWYANRSIRFLLQELLKAGHGNTLPSTFVLPTVVEVDVYAGDTNGRACSAFGRPPDWDGTDWLRKGYVCRASLWASAGNGNRLYLGCDEHIYEYNPATDTYTRMTGATSELGTDVHVRRLWFNSRHTAKPIWGVAWTNQASTSWTVSMKVFSLDPDAVGTKVVVEATVTTVWTGEFCRRDGVTAGGVRFLGTFGTLMRGENLVAPFGQQIVSVSGQTAFYESVAALGTSASEINDGILSARRTSGNYYVLGFSTDVNMAIRFSAGQHGCVIYNDAVGSKGGIIYATYDGSEIDIMMLLCGDLSENLLLNGWSDGTGMHQPTCGCSVDGTYIVIGTMVWLDTTDATSKSYLFRLNIANISDQTTLYQSASDTGSLYRTFLEAAYNSRDTGEALHVTLVNRDALGLATAFAMGTHDRSSAVNSITVKRHSNRPLRHLCVEIDNANTTTVVEEDTYFIEVGGFRLFQYDISADSVVMLNDGWPCVDDEMTEAANLVMDTTNATRNILYGVSAPDWPPETQSVAPSGKYSLWKYDTTRTGRVELADFSSLTVWQALELLAWMADYVMGYEVDGNFFFVPRPALNTPDFIFANDRWITGSPENVWTQRIYAIEKSFGWDEIYNTAEITPYLVKFQSPAGEILLKTRPTGYYRGTGSTDLDKQPPFVPMAIDQRDTRTVTLTLICTKGGKISSSTNPPRFKWLTTDPIIETRLAAGVTVSQTTGILLGSVFGGTENTGGVHDGDWLVLKSQVDGSDISRRITAVDPDVNSVSVVSAFNQAFNANDPAYIMKRNVSSSTTSTMATWSDEGVTYINDTDLSGTAVTVASIQDLAVGVWVGTAINEARITAINPTTLTLTVDASLTWTNGEALRAWVAPNTNDKPFAIGGSQVYLKFLKPTSGTAEQDWTEEFLEGDKILVKCPGLTLVADAQSKQSHADTPSIGRYDRQPFPIQENRFLSRSLAKDWAKRLVRTYKEPCYVLTVTGLFVPYLTFLTSSQTLYRVSVIDELIFPLSQEYGRLFAQIGYIREIRHDPDRGTTTLVLRGARNY
jgi:hypothetical protein